MHEGNFSSFPNDTVQLGESGKLMVNTPAACLVTSAVGGIDLISSIMCAWIRGGVLLMYAGMVRFLLL